MTFQYPKDLHKNLSMNFVVKEVQLTKDYKELFSDSTSHIASSLQGKNQEVLSAKLLKDGALLATLTLPIPNALDESINHTWNQETGIVSDVVNAGIGKLGGVGQKALKAGSQSLSNTGVRAPATDPGYFQKYAGTDCRQFSFSWEFVPKSKEEADQILGIIRAFKIFAAPSKLASNIALIAPSFWMVELGNKTLSDAMVFQPMVCTMVTSNWTGGGIMDVYVDGIPKFITLSVAFREVTALTRQTYDPKMETALSDAYDSITSIFSDIGAKGAAEDAADTTASNA